MQLLFMSLISVESQVLGRSHAPKPQRPLRFLCSDPSIEGQRNRQSETWNYTPLAWRYSLRNDTHLTHLPYSEVSFTKGRLLRNGIELQSSENELLLRSLLKRDTRAHNRIVRESSGNQKYMLRHNNAGRTQMPPYPEPLHKNWKDQHRRSDGDHRVAHWTNREH